MENPSVQQLFFQHIKNSLPPHLSLVDAIADVLNISNDSAYRRIRGEKPISLEEIQKLTVYFNISMDQFLHLEKDSFLFTGKLVDTSGDFFKDWLTDLLQKITYIKTFENKHLYWLTKDIPFICFFQVPELATFKFFLWMKTILHFEALAGKKLSFKNNFPEYEEIGRKIVQIYNQVPATEIWNIESINATILQIEFYRQSNLFESKQDILLLYDKLEALINHFEKQAELGKKFNFGELPGPNAAAFNMYLNELCIGDNTVLADLGPVKVTFLNHSVIHNVITRDERFNQFIHDSMMNMMKKSTQISSTGEKIRARFFSRLRDKINNRRAVYQ